MGFADLAQHFIKLLLYTCVFGIYQGFTASAEGYPYKILDLLAGTLLI
jgi:hypothetical protein